MDLPLRYSLDTNKNWLLFRLSNTETKKEIETRKLLKQYLICRIKGGFDSIFEKNGTIFDRKPLFCNNNSNMVNSNKFPKTLKIKRYFQSKFICAYI